MKQKLLNNFRLRAMMLLAMLVVSASGTVWGDSYTITFSTGSGNGSSISTSTACSEIVSEGSSYLSGNLVTATNAYSSGSDGLKLGAKSSGGTIKMNLASSVTPTSIVVNAKRYNSSKAVTLKVNGSATQDLTADFANYTYNITSEISYIELVSSKYCWISSVTVNYAAAKTDPTITFNNGSVNVGQNLDLSTLFSSNSEGDVTYSITEGGSYASLDGTTLTGTAVGSVSVTASQAAAGDYNAGEASATITVNAAKTLSSIAVTTAPTKTTYYEGETFDATGMVVTATYADETQSDVTASCTFTPSTALTTDITSISISYTENENEKTTTQAITVNELPKYTVTFSDGGSVTQESAGASVTLPSRDAVGDYTFAGWSTTDVTTETTDAQSLISAGSYTPEANITLYPVYTRTEIGDSAPVNVSTSISDYATANDWSNSSQYTSVTMDSKITITADGGSNTGKYYSNDNSWRIYSSENATLTVTSTSGDLSSVTLTYSEGAFTYGGNTIGNGTAVEVTGKSAVFTCTTKAFVTNIAVTYQGGPTETTYYTSHPSSKETATWAFSPTTLETMYVGEDDATLTVTTNYDGTLTATSSSDEIATITKTAAKTFTIHAVAAGDATFTISGDETENYKPISKQIAVNVQQKYTVTIETPEGGTLVIKNGEDEVASGSKFLPGVELTAVVTPDETHNFKNWQAVDASTHTYTASYTYTMGSSDVTFKANFDAKVYHKANWSVNGAVASSDDVEEGTAITFPAEDPTVTGYTFTGWSATAIDGSQADAPEYVTEATMGTEDVTYYAVFAKVTEENATATFDASDISNLTESTVYDRCWDDNETGIELYLSDGQRYTGTPKTWTVTNGTDNYFNIEIPSGRLTSIVTTIASSNSNYVIGSVSEGATLGEYADETQTVTFTSDLTSVNCYATSGYQIRASQIVVNAVLYNASAYYTTVPTATITLNAACTDGSLVYGTYSNSSAFVVSEDIEVSEISVIDGQLLVEKYTTGAIVPANTGVMVSAAEGGNYVVNLSNEAGTSVLGSDNCLKASGDAGITADGMTAAAADCLYYRLTMHNGTQIGYYWGAAEGAAFALGANKAYLAVPTSSGIKEFFTFGGLTDAINSVKADNNDKVIFNLAGQRLNRMQKGINIVNGKKILVK